MNAKCWAFFRSIVFQTLGNHFSFEKPFPELWEPVFLLKKQMDLILLANNEPLFADKGMLSSDKVGLLPMNHLIDFLPSHVIGIVLVIIMVELNM